MNMEILHILTYFPLLARVDIYTHIIPIGMDGHKISIGCAHVLDLLNYSNQKSKNVHFHLYPSKGIKGDAVCNPNGLWEVPGTMAQHPAAATFLKGYTFIISALVLDSILCIATLFAMLGCLICQYLF